MQGMVSPTHSGTGRPIATKVVERKQAICEEELN